LPGAEHEAVRVMAVVNRHTAHLGKIQPRQKLLFLSDLWLVLSGMLTAVPLSSPVLPPWILGIWGA